MKAKLYFEAEDRRYVTVEVDKIGTFKDFCEEINKSAPAGLIIGPDWAHPYSRLIRIDKLWD